jgi:hypothetical protein
MIIDIRVYAALLQSGRKIYVVSEADKNGCTLTSDVQDAAAFVRSYINDLKIRKPDNLSGISVSVDYFPFHNIEFDERFKPMWCFQLNGTEMSLFWKEFSKPDQ